MAVIFNISQVRVLSALHKSGEDWVITLDSLRDRQRIQLLHGRFVENTPRKFETFAFECKLTVDEIFDFVGRKLEVQDKQDLMRGFREVPFPKITRFGRQVNAKANEVSASESETEIDTPKSPRQKGKKGGKSRPKSPPAKPFVPAQGVLQGGVSTSNNTRSNAQGTPATSTGP